MVHCPATICAGYVRKITAVGQGAVLLADCGWQAHGGWVSVAAMIAAAHPFTPSIRRWRHQAAALLLAAVLGGCSLFGDSGPIPVAAIGDLHRNPDRAPSPISLPDRLMLDATAQGLVGFAADGQIEAGLAERWTVIDGGKSYIFRLREGRWANGSPVRAADVAAIVQRKINSPRLRPVLRGEFRAVRDVRAMTGRVIEIRLTRPQPDLLDLLAQPDMAVTRNGEGWGPWRPFWTGSTARLVSLPLPGSAEAEAGTPLDELEAAAILWGTSATAAIAQFEAGDVAAVFGGKFEDWPLVEAADIPQDRRLLDPVDGLFGLAVVEPEGLLATETGRSAVAMLIDRSAIDDAMGQPWAARLTLRRVAPGQTLPDSHYPQWINLTLDERRANAATIVRNWQRGPGNGEPPLLLIALPEGPGARMLFARLRADLARGGIEARAVALMANADLRLIDEVAPSSDDGWYVRRLACGRGLACDPETDRLIEAIDVAADERDRTAALSNAEAAIVRHGAFMPLAGPMRWSLSSPRTTGVRPNARGRHSLIRLRQSPN